MAPHLHQVIPFGLGALWLGDANASLAGPLRPRDKLITMIPIGTVTFLFTAIEGSTKLAQSCPDVMSV